MEALDDRDTQVLVRLGYAVARAQLFEFALLKLVDTQQHDPALPLEERWPEIERRLSRWPAGEIARELRLPPEVAEDLRSLGARRGLVVHHVWRLYLASRAQRPDAPDAYCDYLEREAQALGRAYNALVRLSSADTDDALRIWREELPEPVDGVALPD